MKILVIEDSRLLRSAIERTLSRAGYEVVAVGDGQEGLWRAQDVRPDIILLDMMLPTMVGTGVLRQLKQDPLTTSIPDVRTERITGLEALPRWQHPKLGLVPPDKFVRIAENCGLILPIGEWVLRTACSQARKWQDEGLPAVTVAVNVSAVQVRQEGFCELVRKVLCEIGLASQYLELELTESLLLANPDLMLSVVQELKAMGLTLAIDDFGTGYSSFSYLRQFRADKFKIDRTFIQDVAVNPDDAKITAAIISMAQSLRLKVIAEGVEDEAQLSFLRDHKCDETQGYYFSKPLAVDKVADKLRRWSPKQHVRVQAAGAQS